MKEKVLILTGHRLEWIETDHYVLLGDWCQVDHELTDKDITIMQYHWQDRRKFIEDYNYIKVFYNTILQALSEKLNNIHSVNHSVLYWEIIIGPWLLTLLPALYDRWCSIKSIIDRKMNLTVSICEHDIANFSCSNYLEQAHKLQNDDYNFYIFSAIIDYLKPKNLLLINTNLNNVEKIKYRTHNKSVLSAVLKILDKLSVHINPNQEVAFCNPYISKKTMLKIFMGMKIFPNSWSMLNEDFEMLHQNSEVRNEKLKVHCKNTFENFVSEKIMLFLPASYLENYWALVRAIEKIDSKVKLIITANAHISNDTFKVWAAKQKVYNGSHLIISSHGGSIKSKYNLFTDYEETISSRRVVWHRELSDKQLRLPANKYLGRRSRRNYSKNDPIRIIGIDWSRFVTGLSSGPISSLLRCEANKIQKLITLCNEKYQIAMEYQKPLTDNWKLEQEMAKKCNGAFKTSSVTFNKAMTSSSLIICTYPQTTFSDAMVASTPVVLLLSPEFWDFDENFSNVVDELTAAKILFTSYEKLAAHIMNIRKNPLLWWNSEIVESAKKLFFSECLLAEASGEKTWVENCDLLVNNIRNAK